MKEDRLYTVTEIAEHMGLNVSRVRVWIADGRLPAVKYGKTWLVKESDLVAFEKKPRPTGKPGADLLNKEK